MALTLTVLGTAAPHPGPDRPCSGYLLEGGGAKVWVDAGPGTFAELQRHVRPAELTAVWISHLHSDHWADLIAAEAGIGDGGLTVERPIPLYAPAGCARRLVGFFGQTDPDLLDPVFDFRELADGLHLDLDGLRLTSRAVDHAVEAYGLRAEADGAVLAYSGDSGPCDALRQLAEGADTLLCEAYLDRQDARGVHLTPEDAGGLARDARVAELLVTHVGPTLTPEAATERAAAVFGGRTLTARPGQRHQVG
ncbi:MBL fold metallo-hydrolase [Streptomyces sp. NBC_01304]|uniref:MBL fold metallo-hydrolase n=1 Tax=Streptomyces sp. NBC_01304 TaxID=2903818 RepID=UPI002E151B36|nr:MBL fold metallo-hydrolase [Streptomyces sp. NBC_01304]